MDTLTNVFTHLVAGDFAAFDDSVDQIQLTGEIINLPANQWVEARESISIGGVDHPFNTRIRFVNPILSSIILRETKTVNNPDGRIDFNATIVCNRDLQLQLGDEWMDVSEFAVRAIKASAPAAMNMTEETILHILSQYGWNPTERLPMYLQHLGSGKEEFEQIAEHMVHLGAVNNTDEVRNRARGTRSSVLAAYRHREGIPVLNMEISHANRSLSQTNSGFIGFLDGTWGTFTKAMTAHRTRISLQQVLNDPKSTQEAKEAAAAQETAIRNFFQTSTSARAFRNWGGTSEVKNVLDENEPSQFYAQQVPCGRLTVADHSTDTGSVVYSVWVSANRQTNDLPVANLTIPVDVDQAATF